MAEDEDLSPRGVGAASAPEQTGATIPLTFRVVPKDIWLRMHVNTSSTIGAVKDAVLEKLCMPPVDPSLYPTFYEDACAASKGSVLPTTASRVFPKTFLAREPKKTIQEVMLADEQKSNPPDRIALDAPSSNKVRKQQEKARAIRLAARSILRGDPGEGGVGIMGGIGVPRAGSSGSIDALPAYRQSQPLQQSQSKGGHSTDVAGTHRHARDNANIAKKPAPRRQRKQIAAGQKQETSVEQADDTLAFGLDAYSDFYGEGLSGNAEAKKSEEEALASMRGFPPNTLMQKIREELDSTSAIHTSGESSPASQSRTDEEDNDDGDSILDLPGEDDFLDQMRPLSSRSSSSDSMHSHHESLKGLESVDEADDAESYAKSGIREDHLIPQDRDRSNTIRSRNHVDISVLADRIQLDPDLSSGGADRQAHEGRENATTAQSSVDIPARVGSTRGARSGTIMQQDFPTILQPESHDEHSMQPAANSMYQNRLTHLEKAHRLAGIHHDEISSWQSAKHGMAHCFSISSYSNGNALEDWRTVAAFQLRPYELLELQYTHQYYKTHLPRIGEARNKIFATPGDTSGALSTGRGQKGATSMRNPALDFGYLEPFLEGWCYIFKRGSGPSKAQRAGIGIWKLRWLTIRASKFIIFRKRPSFAAELEDNGEVWNLESLDSVFSEQADGVTRPPLPAIIGLCQEMLTLSFRGFFVPPRSIHDEGDRYEKPTVSMRFITMTDHHAFFAAFVRARYRYAMRFSEPALSLLATEWRRRALARATIAGLGGTIVPGRASRRNGRNALARKRLRPPGASREFDDADRWSSASESEDVVPRQRSSDFSYAGTAGRVDLSNLPEMPTLLEVSQSLSSRRSPDATLTSTHPHTNAKTTHPRAELSHTSSSLPSGDAPSQSERMSRLASSLPQFVLGDGEASKERDRNAAKVNAEGVLKDEFTNQNLSIARNPGTQHLRGSPSLTNITAHDLRRQQRFVNP